MAREPVDYWEKRQTELMKRLEKQSEITIQRLVTAYNDAKDEIQKEIRKIFNKYATDGKLTFQEAKKMLNTKESKEFYDKLLQQINTIQDKDIKRELLSKYNAPAYSYRIARYQALQENIDIELAKLIDKENIITKKHYVNIISEAYYREIFNIQQNLGFSFSFAQIDKRTIDLLLNQNWYNSENFSRRIWKNNNKLADYLKQRMLPNYIAGKSINKMANELNEVVQIGTYNATRLLRTETNFFANEAEMLSYEELDIEKYRFIATLDNRTCKHCAELDNKDFNVKNRQSGKNYPPMHPNDRCTTVPVFDDKVTEELERKARNENGKPILVSQNMTYKDWTMQYAPEQYKKYYINANLPKTKSVQDSILDKQLGFYDSTRNLNFIPKNVIISNVHIIAGDGTKTVFRSANKYANKYGGNSEEWMKKVGKIESDKYIFDVHWVEHRKFGKYDEKIGGKHLK